MIERICPFQSLKLFIPCLDSGGTYYVLFVGMLYLISGSHFYELP